MRALAGWSRVALIDLRGSLKRFVLLVACLALGVAAIGTVSAVRGSVEAAIARDARLILGGDLELRAQRADVPGDVVRALEGLGQLSRVVDLSAQASANGRSAFLALRAVDEVYPLVGEVTLLPDGITADMAGLLAARDGQHGVLLGQQAVLRLGIGVGDRVRIGNADFVLRGVIDALPDQAAAGFQLGAPALVSSAALGPAGLRQEGVLSQFRYKVLLAPDRDFESAAAGLAEAYPDADWQVRSPREATATIARFIGVFGNFMLLVALSSMLVGGLGAANAVTAYVAERQGAIATMRALGAKGRRIVFHFLTQLVVLSLGAVVIGLVLVVGATLLLLPLLSGLIGIDLPRQIDGQALAVAGAIGLVTALIFSWIPLVQAQGVRPALLFRAGSTGALPGLSWREWLRPGVALPLVAAAGGLFGLTLLLANDLRLVSVSFLAALFAIGVLRLAAGGLKRAVARAPTPRNRLLRQALSAILRPGAPTTTVLVSLGMGLSLLLLITLTQTNINQQIALEVEAEAPDFVLLDMDAGQREALEGLVANTPAIAELSTIPTLRGIITGLKGAAAPEADAVPPELADLFRGDTVLSWAAEMPEETDLAEGTWWASDYAGAPLVSLSTDMRDGLDLKLGDTISIAIAGRPVEMTIASFRRIDERGPEFSFRILVSPGLIEAAPQSFFGSLKAQPGRAAEVEAALVERLPGVSFVPVGEALVRVQALFDGLVDAIALVSGTAVVAGVLVLAGALSVGRSQREADAVVMKVLGARRGQVIAAFLIEYALLGALAALLAMGLAIAGAWAASTFLLEIGFAVDGVQLVLFSAAIILVTTATGAATTWSAMSSRPAVRLREEG